MVNSRHILGRPEVASPIFLVFEGPKIDPSKRPPLGRRSWHGWQRGTQCHQNTMSGREDRKRFYNTFCISSNLSKCCYLIQVSSPHPLLYSILHENRWSLIPVHINTCAHSQKGLYSRFSQARRRQLPSKQPRRQHTTKCHCTWNNWITRTPFFPSTSGEFSWPPSGGLKRNCKGTVEKSMKETVGGAGGTKNESRKKRWTQPTLPLEVLNWRWPQLASSSNQWLYKKRSADVFTKTRLNNKKKQSWGKRLKVKNPQHLCWGINKRLHSNDVNDPPSRPQLKSFLNCGSFQKASERWGREETPGANASQDKTGRRGTT